MKPMVKQGVTYMDVSDIRLKFTTTKLRIKLDNLFKGDKALGKYIHSGQQINKKALTKN